ncbi:MAG: hypothetical protein VX834_01135 [Myxococcota bacterium]|nr:hypothetical protein [Myxococcota bacterium]
MDQESGVRHLREAMVINTRRGGHYLWVSRGLSLLVSIPLIASELCFIPILGFFDLWGKRFNRLGVNIISGDYVSMSKVKPLGTALRLRGVASSEVHQQLARRNSSFRREALVACWRGDFQTVADLAYAFLQYILDEETRTGALFPMYRHILESLGIAALHAQDYLQQSQGKTLRLSKWFVATQINAMLSCGYFDRCAQWSHQRGAGIIENDVPYIPFVEAYESRGRGAGSDELHGQEHREA